MGRKHDASFRVVLTDSRRAAQGGGFLEIVGNYNPCRDTPAQLKTERIAQLLKNGAQASGTVHNLLVDAKVIPGPKRDVSPSIKKRQKGPEETVQTQAQAEQGTRQEAAQEKEASAESQAVPEPEKPEGVAV